MNALFAPCFALIGMWETILLLMVMLVMAVAVGVVIFLVVKSSTSKGAPPQYQQPTSPPPGTKCPRCGATLTANAPQGMCPRCVFEVGMGTQTAEAPQGERAKAPLPEELASHFPQFEILELLGQGGMGAVYKARQKDLDRIVALKVLPADGGRDPAFAERFTREARAMAKLSHPNIVTVHEFGQAGGFYFFVMEFVDGANLRQTLQAQRLSPREAMAIVPQICEALQYAHDQGIVHRDIKPENVLLDKQGRVKIADFGLAKLLGKELPGARLTRSAEVMGTPQYMAPEQLEKPLEVDHRADIYSLGVVFYEMLTGELPLGRFAPPSRKVQVDVRLDEVVLRALEKEPELRYQQASQFKTQVETIASGRASLPVPVRTAPSPVGKRLVMAGAVGLVAFLVTVIAVCLFAFNGPKTVYTSSALISPRFEDAAMTPELEAARKGVEIERLLSGIVLSKVASNLNLGLRWSRKRDAELDEQQVLLLLRRGIRVQSPPRGSTLRIHYSGDSPNEVQQITDELVQVYRATTAGAVKVDVFQRASPPKAETRLTKLILFVGMVVALLVALVSGPLHSQSSRDGHALVALWLSRVGPRIQEWCGCCQRWGW